MTADPRLIVPLDLPTVDDARAMVERLGDAVSFYKIGLGMLTGGGLALANELKAEGFLMMPAGRNGPAFIVTPNFYVLKEYNESDLYALFIGNLGDRYGQRSNPRLGAECAH